MNEYFIGLLAFPASAFYALSIRAPWKSVFIASFCGMTGQLIYVLGTHHFNVYFSVFIATLTVCVISEVASRFAKLPATVITYPALTPLVPGVMLYRAMLAFSSSDFSGGAVQIICVLAYAGCMAIAITISTVFAKTCLSPLFALYKKRKQRIIK